jgi:hypothetical protein
MNQNVDAMLLGAGQYAMGSNITSRGGLVSTRPAFDRMAEVASSGKFQGAFFYELNSLKQIIFGVDGHVHAIDMSDLSITDHGLLLHPTSDQFYFVKADQYCIIQDDYHPETWAAANWPVILDGAAIYDQSALRASDPEDCVPKGGPMAYGHGRLFVSVPYVYTDGDGWTDNIGLSGFVASDIILAHDKDNMLLFTDETYLATGGRIILPEELGFITAMGFQKNVISGVGQGPLVVGAERGFSSFAIQAPRSSWGDIDFGVVMFSGIGTLSQRSWINSSSDIVYRATDGWRSLATTRSELGSASLSESNLSPEVRDLIALDTKSCQPLISGARLDNRILMASNPGENNTFKSLISLDVAAVSSLNQSTSPIYDGVWTGYDFYQVLTATYDSEDHVMALVRTSSGSIDLVRIDEDIEKDEDETSIKCRLETAYQHFGSPFARNKFRYMELFLSGLVGDATVTAYFRPDHYALWAKMTTATLKSDATGYAHKRKVIRFTPEEPVPADPVEFTTVDSGYMFQFMLEWTGRLQVDRVMFIAEMQQPDYIPSPVETESTKVEETENLVFVDHYDYEVHP